MANESHIHGSHNIVIQEVSDSILTLNIGGEVQEIRNDLAELKDLLSRLQTNRVQYADKIYNIEHITEANFGVVTSSRVFNAVLVRQRVDMLKDQPEIREFLQGIPQEHQADWENIPQHLKEAQGRVERSYNWLIGWQLRRLFSIGNDRTKGIEVKIVEYMHHCFETYRLSLQLMNFILLAHLWDIQTNGAGLVITDPTIRNFFTSKRPFTLAELRKLLIALIQLYIDNGLAFPLSEQDTRHLPEVANPGSKLQVAGQELERLEMLNQNTERYGLGHCHTAEIELSNVLATFPFFAKYSLITMREIEYEELRHSKPVYIKDYQKLGSDPKKSGNQEQQEVNQKVKYDDKPALSYAVSFNNAQSSISLFPFVIDYNLLNGDGDFQILVYVCRDGVSSLRYFSVRYEQEQAISYQGVVRSKPFEKKQDDQKLKTIQKEIRLDLVIKQFEQAMNTLLGTSEQFVPAGVGEIDNI